MAAFHNTHKTDDTSMFLFHLFIYFSRHISHALCRAILLRIIFTNNKFLKMSNIFRITSLVNMKKQNMIKDKQEFSTLGKTKLSSD